MAEGIITRRGGIKKEFIEATGGTVTDITQDGELFRVHTFTSSGTFEVTSGEGTVEYLVVAGGGGGSSENFGGGGGAGGYRASVNGESSGGGANAESPISLPEGVYTVTIGNGGAVENNGQNSVFHTITCLGGGFGQTRVPAGDGGSGGGCANVDLQGSGTFSQGFDGQRGDSDIAVGSGSGGGGGAGAIGTEGTAGQGGDGGIGVASQIDGTSTARAGGGAGTSNTGNNGTGGLGGGGDGNGQNGAINTGGGGGANGGAGGSGIVIVRYRLG